jgi:hypothetical protein
MDDGLNERTAAALDSASTWRGVTWAGGGTVSELRIDGRVFGRVGEDGLEVAFPGRLAEAVVRHEMAERHEDTGWTRLPVEDVQEAVALLRLSHLSHVAHIRRIRAAYTDVDLDDALAELDLSPGLIHLVRELQRRE